MTENNITYYTNENRTLKNITQNNENIIDNLSKKNNDSNSKENNKINEEEEEIQIQELQNKIQNEILIKEIDFIKNKINKEGGLIKIQKDKDEYKKSDCYIITLFFCNFFILTLNIISIYQITTIKDALFEEIKDDLLSYVYREKKKKNFYIRLIDQTFKEIPVLEISLFFQFLTVPILKKFNFLCTNIVCYIINLICLILLIIFSFNVKLNKYYTGIQDLILISIYFFMLLASSIYSLTTLERCILNNKIYFKNGYFCYKFNCETCSNSSVKFIIIFFNSFLDCFVKIFSMYLKFYINKVIYKYFDYNINQRIYLFTIFSVYFVSQFLVLIFLLF